MTALYNDFAPDAAAWLRELIADGHIPPGEVSTASIKELSPDECPETSHFFAGIGGWPLALRIVGWPSGDPVWTGSCPCQPFSTAGKRMGTDDPRHLWPDFARLIGERRPPIVFGEQVAGADGIAWLAGVRSDLEAMGYAVGAADLCSAGVGAPHIRQRLYWGAKRLDYTASARHEPARGGQPAESERRRGLSGMGCEVGGLADADDARLAEREGEPGDVGQERQATQRSGTGIPERPICDPRRSWRLAYCRDGKWRRIPTESALFPLGARIPEGVGLLRGSGNAIDPWVAAAFVTAFMEARI